MTLLSDAQIIYAGELVLSKPAIAGIVTYPPFSVAIFGDPTASTGGGGGTVVSVNGQSPDGSGNVAVAASAMPIVDVGNLYTATQVEAALAEVRTALNVEAATRAGNDTSEATARAAADTAETSARISGDTANASALTAEATARASADSTLAGSISSEASARTAADVTLAASIATRMAGLIPTAMKTANYTAAGGDFVRCDTTSAGFTVLLPNAPADKTLVGIKQVIRGGTNGIGIGCQGSDVINRTGGATIYPLTLQGQAVLFQYETSTGIWHVFADDLPLSQLDIRYQASLVTQAVRTTAGTLTGGTINPVDISGGGFTVTLPSAPTDETVVVVSLVAVAPGNALTLQRGGTDTLYLPGGPTSETFILLHEAVELQYDAGTAVWAMRSQNTREQLDLRYATNVSVAGIIRKATGSPFIMGDGVLLYHDVAHGLGEPYPIIINVRNNLTNAVVDVDHVALDANTLRFGPYATAPPTNGIIYKIAD